MAASRYRIVLRGRLSESFESAFDGMTLEHGPNRTVLTGDVRDQAQLYGLIGRLQEFGIELLAVEPADAPDGGSGPCARDPKLLAGRGHAHLAAGIGDRIPRNICTLSLSRFSPDRAPGSITSRI